jgi:hypothetical protein
VTNDRTERLLSEIGGLLAVDTAYPLEGTLLYAVLDTNYVRASIFKDLGDHVVYRPPNLNTLGRALLDLWEAQDTDDRWREIEYVVRGDTFEAEYTYPDEIDPDEEPLDRRDRVVARHFGDKPITYPPPTEEDSFLFEL